MRRLPIHTVVLLSLPLLSTPALANSTGTHGQSSKQGVNCNGCHLGASAPKVELSGPSELAPGETGQYSLTITGGAAKVGGLNIAVDNAAAVLMPGEGQQKLGDELTHTAPKAFTNGTLRFDFSLVAPSKPGTIKLFGSGNSANGDLGSTGDRGSSTSMSVTIPGATPVDEGDDLQKQGCSASSGISLAGLALVTTGLLRSRRRS
jgi:uncharacterized protein (TIGR03382 family)